MAKIALSELRTTISEVTLRSGGATPQALVATLRKGHASKINAASRQLEDIALVKLINDVGNRSRVPVPGQLSLFAGFSVPDTLAIPAIVDGKKVSLHVPFDDASKEQVEAWIEKHEKKPRAASRRTQQVSALLDELRPYLPSGQTTMREAGEARKNAKGDG